MLVERSPCLDHQVLWNLPRVCIGCPNWPMGVLCNTPHVTFHICNSDSCHFRLCIMIFPPLSGFVFRFVFCHVMHFISCHHVHCIRIRVRLLYLSIFPVVRVAIRRSHLLRRTPLVFFRERVSNVLGMDRGLSSGLLIPPGDYRSSFVPFGGRLVLQRLTGHPQSPFECPAKTPSKPSPKPTKLSSML